MLTWYPLASGRRTGSPIDGVTANIHYSLSVRMAYSQFVSVPCSRLPCWALNVVARQGKNDRDSQYSTFNLSFVDLLPFESEYTFCFGTPSGPWCLTCKVAMERTLVFELEDYRYGHNEPFQTKRDF